MSKTISIITEGTFPYVTGGLGRWCSDLVSGLVNFKFNIYAFTATRYHVFQYPITNNIEEIVTVPLWDDNRFQHFYYRRKIKKKDFQGN